jgi:hypothetical protein
METSDVQPGTEYAEIGSALWERVRIEHGLAADEVDDWLASAPTTLPVLEPGLAGPVTI